MRLCHLGASPKPRLNEGATAVRYGHVLCVNTEPVHACNGCSALSFRQSTLVFVDIKNGVPIPPVSFFDFVSQKVTELL